MYCLLNSMLAPAVLCGLAIRMVFPCNAAAVEANASSPPIPVFITALASDSAGHLWLATEDEGMYKTDPFMGDSPLIEPVNTPTVVQEVDHKYKMTTAPSGSYSGNVKCRTVISANEDIYLYALGLFGDSGTCVCSTSFKCTDSIKVSGLFLGNGPCTPRLLSCNAPHFILIPEWTEKYCGGLQWINNDTVYTVDAIVSVQNRISMRGSRDGILPQSGSGNGYIRTSGFYFDSFCDFTIIPNN